MVLKFSRFENADEKIAPNFKLGEFASGGGADEIRISTELVCRLQELRDYMRMDSLEIVSGFRTVAWNAHIKGSKTSKHCLGLASDVRGYKNKAKNIRFSSIEIARAAQLIGFDGIGIINDTNVHLDMRGKKYWFDERFKDENGNFKTVGDFNVYKL